MRNLLFILAVSFGLTCSMFAQDVDIKHPDSLQAEVKVPRLIITEINTHDPYRYMEITNLEDSAVSLKDFTVGNFLNTHIYDRDAAGYITGGLFDIETRYWGQDLGRWFTPGFGDDVIGPHESIVITTVWDRPLNEFNLDKPRHIEKIVDESDYYVHVLESGEGLPYLDKPEVQAFGFDSVSESSEFLRGNGPFALMYNYFRLDSLGDTIDYSILADQVALAESVELDGRTHLEEAWPIAGVADHKAWILVRKGNVTEPNLDWHDSRGTSAANSEWMVLPLYQGREPYTTIGNFGNYEMTITPMSNKVSVDGNILTLPWEAKRYDDIIANWLQLGDGMAWQYFKSGTSEDSAFVTVQNGDTLRLYVTGTSLRTQDYIVNVTNPSDEVAAVFPKIAKYYSTGAYANNASIIVTDDDPVLDTIMNVPFQQIIDSFKLDLDYPSNASLEYVPVDGDANRTEIMTGDKLKVTSANGVNVKEYYIKPNVYEPNEDATLASLAFPEYEMDGYFWEWESAVLPGFAPQNTYMVLKVSSDRASVPALSAMPNNRNATVKVKRAVNLTGSMEERTTTFTVTSESGIEKVYQVRFDKDIDLKLVQPVVGAEPFVCGAYRQPGGSRSANYYVSIYNPNSFPLDLSDYMLCNWSTRNGTVEGTIQSAVGTDTIPSGGDFNYYIPGYKYDLARWKAAEPGFLYKMPMLRL